MYCNIYKTDFRACYRAYLFKFGAQENLMLKFTQDQALNGKKDNTIYRYAKDMLFWMQLIKRPFADATKEDIRNALVEAQGLNLHENTRNKRKSTLKIFFAWLGKEDLVSWIKIRLKCNYFVPPGLLLQPEDIQKLIENANTLTKKALILLHWETGGRIGETLNLRVKDISFDDQVAYVKMEGKTGSRYAPVLQSKALLWLLTYQKDPNDFVFRNGRGNNLNYMNFLSILKKLKILTGITKPLNTHFFRKSRSTYLARKGWNELQLGAYQGWVFGSPMPRVYVQMGASDLKEQVLNFT